MAMTLEQELASALEMEGLGELEGLGEFEGLGELEGLGESESEAEAEQFFGRLAKMATSPALKRIGLAAARAAVQGLRETEYEGEGELGEYEWESTLEGEGAFEGESEGESEYELNPIRRVYPDAMMEHLAHEAVNAESEQEAAEQFFPLVGLAAAKLLPLAAKALPKVMKVAPKLIRGVSNVTRTLHRNRGTRPLVRTVPTIVNRTVNTLARQAAQGRPITSQNAVRALAQQTNRMLSNPRQSVQAYQRSRTLDNQMHRIAGVRAARRKCR